MNLQLPRCTADTSPCRWWALTSPSHHFCPKAVVVFFCITQPSRTASTLGSGMPCAARTFLLWLCRTTSDRPSGCFPAAKVRLSEYNTKEKSIFSLLLSDESTLDVVNGTIKWGKNQIFLSISERELKKQIIDKLTFLLRQSYRWRLSFGLRYEWGDGDAKSGVWTVEHAGGFPKNVENLETLLRHAMEVHNFAKKSKSQHFNFTLIFVFLMATNTKKCKKWGTWN